MADNDCNDPVNTFKTVGYIGIGVMFLALSGMIGMGKGAEQAQKDGIPCTLDESFAKAVTAQIVGGDTSIKIAANQDGQCRLKITTAKNGYMP